MKITAKILDTNEVIDINNYDGDEYHFSFGKDGIIIKYHEEYQYEGGGEIHDGWRWVEVDAEITCTDTPKWIAVTPESLPEKHTRVTVCEWTLGLSDPSIIQASWEGDRWRLYGGMKAENITHWMPLPEPPKQD